MSERRPRTGALIIGCWSYPGPAWPRSARSPRGGEEAGGAPGTLAQHKLNPLAYSLLYVDGPWVNGILVSHLWSVAGRSSRQDVSVPIGVDVGRTFTIGSQGISLQIGAYDNVKKPTGAAEWVLDTQVSWLY